MDPRRGACRLCCQCTPCGIGIKPWAGRSFTSISGTPHLLVAQLTHLLFQPDARTSAEPRNHDWQNIPIPLKLLEVGNEGVGSPSPSLCLFSPVSGHWRDLALCLFWFLA